MLIAQIAQEKAAKELTLLLTDRKKANGLLAHATSVLREREDVRYRFSRDIAVAVYVWALNHSNKGLAKLLAAEIVNTPRVWWARKLAVESVGGPLVNPEVRDEVVVKTNWGAPNSQVNFSTQTKDVIVISEPSELDNQLLVSGRIVQQDATLTSDAVGIEKSLSTVTTNSTSTTTKTDSVLPQ